MVVQWVCDDPYFRDWENTSKSAFNRVNHIGENAGKFSLPMVFTSRITHAAIINSGFFPVEPVVNISVVRREGAVGNGTKGMVVENLTTGEEIRFDYPAQASNTEDRITVNIPDRVIISERYGDITNLISVDTFLHRLVLEKGENAVKISNLNTNYHTTATVEYCNRYVECEYTKE